jgi:hypothetical protein
MRQKTVTAKPSSVPQEICHAEALGLSETGIQIHDNIAIAEAPSAQPIANKAQQGNRRSDRNQQREEYHEEHPHWDPSTDEACDIQASQDDDPDMTDSEFIALNLTIKQALEEYGDGAVESVTAELQQLLDKGVAHDQITAAVLKSAIPLKMFTKAKLAADGSIVKLKSRYASRGDKQDRGLRIDEDLSGSTADCLTEYTVLVTTESERRQDHSLVTSVHQQEPSTSRRWTWHMTCDDGTQLTAIQFADDLLDEHRAERRRRLTATRLVDHLLANHAHWSHLHPAAAHSTRTIAQ